MLYLAVLNNALDPIPEEDYFQKDIYSFLSKDSPLVIFSRRSDQ